MANKTHYANLKERSCITKEKAFKFEKSFNIFNGTFLLLFEPGILKFHFILSGTVFVAGSVIIIITIINRSGP